jgi:hypothetical protein
MMASQTGHEDRTPRRLKAMIARTGYPALFLATLWVLFPVHVFAASKTVPGDYASIQAAVDALVANPSLGDTILVKVGTHSENVLISGATNLTIEGEETARSKMLAAAGGATVKIDASSNVIIRNLYWLDSTLGIQVSNSSNIDITGNAFALGDTGTAVQVDDLSDVAVSNNSFYQNQIALTRASDTTQVMNNIFAENTLAIDTQLTGNISYNCFYGNDADGAQGTNAVTGKDPRFVDAASGDFHLQPDSPAIDQGSGSDVIDDTTADMGAYGGPDADVKPFPVQDVVVSDVSAQTGNPALQVSWSANGSYLVSDTTDPGGYRLYYDADAAGPPYEGQDAAGGSEPSPIDVGNVTSYILDNLSPDATLPAAPVLAPPEPANAILKLSWSAVEGASSYKLYYGVNAVDENVVEAGNATQYTLHGLDNGVSYRLAVSAVAQARYYVALRAYDNTGTSDHVSAYSDEKSITLGAAREGPLSDERTGIPEAVVPYPALPNEGCFIATAAFGYYSASQVQVLRDFRDRFLLTNGPGRVFVHVYYTYGPRLARLMDAHPASKPVVRVLLYPLILFAALCLQSPLGVLALLLLTGALLAYRYYGIAPSHAAQTRK